MNEEMNYDEYNRNNNLINNIRYGDRYNVDDLNGTLQNNNINTINRNNINNQFNNNIDNKNEQNFNNNTMENTLNSNNNIRTNYGNNNINNNNNLNLNNSINNNINNSNNINNENMNMNINEYNNNNNAINITNSSINQNINNENNLYKSEDINVGLNKWVKNDLNSLGLHVGRSNSPNTIRISHRDKKKLLLENIQAQINLRKKTKLEELNKRKQEDAKYLQDMVIFYPFGRGGGGAPNRDKSGNINANRRGLISNPKYNFASINVDDDYDDVWNKEKRIGRFYKNSNEFSNINNNINNEENISYTPQKNNNYNFQQMNNNRPFSTYPRQMNLNNNPGFNNNQFRMNKRIQALNNQLSMSMNINNELLNKLREQNKVLEKQLEEERENEKLRKEIEKAENEEKEKNLSKTKIIQEETDTEEENEIERNNIYKIKTIERDIIDPDSIILDKNAIEQINRSEIESRNKLNNEIYKLRNQMQNQQMLLFQQISNLKTEAEKANSQREEALREIERLKLQIYKENNEDRQKRYIHHVIVSDNDNKEKERSVQTEEPKNNEDNLELNKLLRKNIDRLKYLEEIERLNALRKSPPSNYEYEFPKNNVIPENEEDEDLYEIEISKINNN